MHIIRPHLYTAVSIAGICAGLVAAPVTAAEDQDAGGDIVVTARHRQESAQKVPIALSVVGADTLAKRGDYTIAQIQQIVPSLRLVATNPRNASINIRGLGANSSIANDGLENGVGVYLDGVYYARPGQSQFDLIDLDRVEVLRGPQGTLFGKNTTAGAINITTRAPSFTPEVEAQGEIGNYRYSQIRAAVSGPIVDGLVAGRLSISNTSRGGFLTNVTTGRKQQDYDNFSVRGQLLFTPTPDLNIRLIGDYSNLRQECCMQVLDGVVTTRADGTTIANNFMIRAARSGYTVRPFDAFSRTTDANSPIQANMVTGGLSAQVDWQVASDISLTSITAWRKWDWHPKNDPDYIALPIWTVGQVDNYQSQFSQELRLSSTGQKTIDWQVGLYYFHQKIVGEGLFSYGSSAAAWNRPATSPYSAALWTTALDGFTAVSRDDPRTDSYAAFGQATWHISDALSLTGGLRYTHEKKVGSFTQSQVGGQSIDGLSTADQAAVLSIRNQFYPTADYIARDKDNSLSGLATLSWQIDPDVLAYASYSRGNKSGGLNLTNLPSGVTAVVQPERVDNYEVGLKSQFFDRALTVNLAGFWTQVRNYQTSIIEQTSATVSRTYIANIPSVRSRGFEADAQWRVSPLASFSGSVAYTDATYRSFANAPAPLETANLNLGIAELSGQTLPGVAKWAFNVGTDARQPLGGGDVALYAHADYSYRSKATSVTLVNNSIYGQIPAYGLVNGRIGISREDGRWDLSFFVRNLFDKDYFLSRTPQATGLITAVIGEPRTLGLTLRTKW